MIEKIKNKAIDLRVNFEHFACNVLMWLSIKSDGRIHSMKIYYYFHKMTWRKDDWMYETK